MTPDAGPRPDVPLVHVLAGVLVDCAGRVLLAERPAGKAFAGRWEFPGGKLEAGETPRSALARELQEELGIEVLEAEPLLAVVHRYPGAPVRVLIDNASLASQAVGPPSSNVEMSADGRTLMDIGKRLLPVGCGTVR
jgi:mutator protein MutT